jgi:hypothetical protein
MQEGRKTPPIHINLRIAEIKKREERRERDPLQKIDVWHNLPVLTE